jgi:hypothetical protein
MAKYIRIYIYMLEFYRSINIDISTYCIIVIFVLFFPKKTRSRVLAIIASYYVSDDDDDLKYNEDFAGLEEVRFQDKRAMKVRIIDCT